MSEQTFKDQAVTGIIRCDAPLGLGSHRGGITVLFVHVVGNLEQEEFYQFVHKWRPSAQAAAEPRHAPKFGAKGLIPDRDK